MRLQRNKNMIVGISLVIGIVYIMSGCVPVQETPEPRPAPPKSEQQTEQAVERLTAEWAYQQGLDYLGKGNLSEAVRYFQMAIERDAMHLRAYLSLGDVYSMQQKFLIAETYYNKVLKYDPESVPAYTALGTMHWNMGNYRDALSFFRKVVEIEPSNQFARQQVEKVTKELFDWYYEQAMAYKDTGDIERALIEFQKAQSLYPENIEFAVEIGNLFLEQQDYVMADGYFQQALSRDPNYVPATIGAGKVQLALQHYNEAANYFENSLENQSDNQEARNLLRRTQSTQVSASLPSQYAAIATKEYVTRGEVTALLMVDLMLENRLSAPGRVAIISDITTHWTKPYIIKTVQLNLMGLPPDRYFRPNEPIRKGELALVLDTVLRELSVPLPTGSSVSFSDLHPENQYYNSALRLYSAGVMNAESEVSFGIVNPVSGAEMMQILERVKTMIR